MGTHNIVTMKGQDYIDIGRNLKSDVERIKYLEDIIIFIENRDKQFLELTKKAYSNGVRKKFERTMNELSVLSDRLDNEDLRYCVDQMSKILDNL